LLLGVETSLQLAAAIELTMSPIIIETTVVDHVVGVGIVDEVFDFFTVLLIVLCLVLVFNLGFDIEESGPVVLAPLTTTTLPKCVSRKLIMQQPLYQTACAQTKQHMTSSSDGRGKLG
jgi:hypothetical protein